MQVYDRVLTVGTVGREHLRARTVPLCAKIMLQAYHKYGLKHVLLIGAFALYVLFGALIFVLIEGPYEQQLLVDRVCFL